MRGQDFQPLQLYKKGGKKARFHKLTKDAAKVDIILFGESHDLSLVHWIELRILQGLASEHSVLLGLEMFETDEQRNIDRLQSGEWDMAAFKSQTELWSNFDTDYQPLVEWALKNGIGVFATNAPADLPSQVFRKGFEILEGLDAETTALLPPLPLPYDPSLPGYQAMLDMNHGGMNSANFPKAQALRDASMAYQISQRANSKHKILHINGSYHSDNFEGIYWYLTQYQPSPRILTVSVVTQESIESLEEKYHNQADYILCIPSDMFRTYQTSF